MKKMLFFAVALWGTVSFAAECEIVDGQTWSYAVRNGEAEIEGILVPPLLGGEGSVLYIPEKLGGFPVTKMHEAAFCQKGYSKVVIPASIDRCRIR